MSENNLCVKCFKFGHFAHECELTEHSLREVYSKRESAIKTNFIKNPEENLNTPNYLFSKNRRELHEHTPDSMDKYLQNGNSPQDLGAIRTPSASFTPRPLFLPQQSQSILNTSQIFCASNRPLHHHQPSASNSSQALNDVIPHPQVQAVNDLFPNGQAVNNTNETRTLEPLGSKDYESSSRPGKNKFQCPGCDGYFLLDSVQFQSHCVSIHNLGTESVAFQWFLRKHRFMQELIKTRKLVCKTCGTSYKDINDVKLCRAQHKQEESGEFGPQNKGDKETDNILKCDIEGCLGSSKIYKNRRTLQKHQRDRHKYFRSTKGAEGESGKSGNVLYTCKFCGHVQYHSGNLKRHEKTCKSRPGEAVSGVAVEPQVEDQLNKMSQESKSSVDSSSGLVL